MRPVPPRLPHSRASLEPAARLERVLAVGRAFLTVTGFIAIYLDPTEPAQFRAVTYGVLLGYVVYSLAMLAVIHRAMRLTPRHGLAIHAMDVLWTSALTFVSQGPISPFFIYFLFVVVAAAYRWGFRETVGTALVTVGVFLAETAIAAAGPWSSTWISPTGFELNRTILRAAYLLITGALLGYLAEQQKLARSELTAIADATHQLRVDLGLGGSVLAVARALMNTFAASAVDVVVYEQTTRRTLLWQCSTGGEGALGDRVTRTILDEAGHSRWFFRDPGRAWQVHRSSPSIARVAEPGIWPLQRQALALPDALSSGPFHTLTVVNLGLAGEWEARVYLHDIGETRHPERSVHFLQALADQLTPALTNVFLLRRLRARAGAAERARVARELHDGAIQSLCGIAMKIAAMRRERDRAPADADAELAGIQDLLRREVLALRELMQALRPIELDGGEQLPDVLAGLVERFRRDTGISARFVFGGGRVDIEPARAIEVIRIVQEALVNVRKHSRANNVLVRLTAANGALDLVVEDDGRGFGFEGRLSARELDERRVGPAIIKERARIARASLAVDSTPGAGTRLEVALREEVHA